MTTAEAIALANEVRSRRSLSKAQSVTLQKRIAAGAAALAKSFDGLATSIAAVNDQIATAHARLANIDKHYPPVTCQ